MALVFGFCFCRAVADLPELVSTPPSGYGPAVSGGGDSGNSFLTPDGRFVLFASSANNLVAAGTNTPFLSPLPLRMNVYLRNRTNGTTALVSLNRSGTGGGNDDSACTAISTNGRYALFESSASDLVPNDTNNLSDIFVRDLVNGTTLLVNVSTNGGSANRESRDSVMTPDGRYVAFVSSANNLVPNDTNGIPDVFVRDLLLGTTVVASVGARTPGFGITVKAYAPQITPDGRYVAFYDLATNLVPASWYGDEIYLRDLVAGITYAVSAIPSPSYLGRINYNHLVSDDGQFVAFERNLTAGVTNGTIYRYRVQGGGLDLVSSNAVANSTSLATFQSLDMTPDGRFITYLAYSNTGPGTVTSCVFVWDAMTETTTLVSVDLNGGVTTNSWCELPIIESSGRFISFLSTATNLTTNVIAPDVHLYVRDLQYNTTRLVDVGTNGTGSAKGSLNTYGLTPDGHFISFDCADTDVVPGDHNRASDVFLRDLFADTTELISARAPDLPSDTFPGASISSFFSVSSDGRYIAFASDAPDPTVNDTNRTRDIYVHDMLAGTNILVSAATNGMAPGSGVSLLPLMSADGRYVAFGSTAGDLVAGDSNQLPDVFRRDLDTGTTALVSIGTNGAPGNKRSVPLLMSDDGRYVLFYSQAGNLAKVTSPPLVENLFLRDLQLAKTTAITTNNATLGDFVVRMSKDGKVVAYMSNISSGTTPLYVWNSQATTQIVANAGPSSLYALSSDGRRLAYLDILNLTVRDLIANTNVVVSEVDFFFIRNPPTPQFSGDGRFLAYATSQSHSSFDTNGLMDIYVYDFESGTNQLVSRNFSAGYAPNRPSDLPAISPDGRFVAYRSFATNMVPTLTNGTRQTYLYDRQVGITTVIGPSALSGGAANSRAQAMVFSGNSQNLVFRSSAADLLTLDFNQSEDIFSWKLASSDPTLAFIGQMVYAPASGKSPTLTWPVMAGKSYEVQFKGDLTDTFWQPLNGTVTVIGNRGYATDLAPSPTQRFYRILAY